MPFKDREKAKAYRKEWQQNNRDKTRKYSRDWFYENPEKKREATRKYRKRNPDKVKKWNHDGRIRRKIRVFSHYSNGEPRCVCCGEDTFEFLTIDHINGGGSEHKRKIGLSRGDQIYRWLIQNNFPDGFQVLCMNCNWAKGQYGYCPHKDSWHPQHKAANRKP